MVWVELEPAPADAPAGTPPAYALRQPPEVEGAVVALDPHTGRVLAMSGGFSYARSVFNRATQALRQPGSALKPFVYLAGLESGLTPSSILLDAPIVIDQGPGLGKWKPVNYSGHFYGPSTLRLGIEKSRNLMTVRLAQTAGMDRVVEMVHRFGIDRGMGRNLASALGAGEVDLLSLTSAYATPGERRQAARAGADRAHSGPSRPHRAAPRRPALPGLRPRRLAGSAAPLLVDQREQVIPAPRAYQMVNLLQGVVERGTGVRARALGKPVAGKTGTSNDSRDAWFIGFTPDLVVGVFIGYDQPKSLGDSRAGRFGRAAGVRRGHDRRAGRPAGDAVPGPAGRAAGAGRRRRPACWPGRAAAA